MIETQSESAGRPLASRTFSHGWGPQELFVPMPCHMASVCTRTCGLYPARINRRGVVAEETTADLGTSMPALHPKLHHQDTSCSSQWHLRQAMPQCHTTPQRVHSADAPRLHMQAAQVTCNPLE